jgi:hypothetical protein
LRSAAVDAAVAAAKNIAKRIAIKIDFRRGCMKASLLLIRESASCPVLRQGLFRTDSWKHAPGKMTIPRWRRAEVEKCCAMILAQN